MEGIPEDLIVEILLRFPVEDLLRLRCVSKRWCKLIDSPNFVKFQLNLPNKPQFVMGLVFNEKLRIYYSELNSDYIENPSPNFKELTTQWRHVTYSFVVGHCNGLLCFFCEYDSTFLVFNPFTGKHIEVPPPPPEVNPCRLWAMGFGYDRDSDAYKVVVFEKRGWRDGGCVVWIYSLKSGSWKEIDDNFPHIPVNYKGVFVNGALHWIVRPYKEDPSKLSIIALNNGNSEYFSVPFPSGYSDNLSELGVLDGCLYAICWGPRGNSYGFCCDLWVMKEYGLKESWIRLGTYNELIYEFYDFRDLVFVSYGNSVVHCKVEKFGRKIGKAIGKPLVYEPSLVCARSGICDP